MVHGALPSIIGLPIKNQWNTTSAVPRFKHSDRSMAKKHNHPQDAVTLGDVLKSVLRPGHSRGNFELTQIWSIWDRAVGSVIAENTHPAGFKGNILLVYANSSAWMHQLQFLKEDIIDKLNTEAGEQLVTDIRFKVGTWE